MEQVKTVNSAPDSPSLSISNKPNKPLALKLNKILNSSASEDAKIKAALTSLSNIPDLEESSLRKNLRGTIEKKEIETNKKFLSAFEKVVKVQNALGMKGALECKNLYHTLHSNLNVWKHKWDKWKTSAKI